jgi:hypothetical protein
VADRGAVTLVEEVLEAHGGAARWDAARRVHAQARSGGFLLRSRVPGTRFADYGLTVDLEERRTVFDPFPEPGTRGVFDRGTARLERGDGEVIASRTEPRKAFFGRSGLRRNLRWDALDATYFAGYAMWNYLSFPQLLLHPGVEAREISPWRSDGEALRRLEVDFPEGLDTHSPRQTFYVGADGLVRRHDYVADVVGRWARAAHLCADHVEADGLVFPTRRWVRPIGPRNRPLPLPTMVWIRITDLRVETG